MRRFLLTALGALALCVLALALTALGLRASMPDYPDALSLDPNVTEKITGQSLVRQAAREGELLIFGSSELKTTEICTHPANFFADYRSGFTVDLVGRGSCQSLVHAMCIAGAGDALNGKSVVLITSPQSYVPEGIAPDLFLANFSELQMLTLLSDESLPRQTRSYMARRVTALTEQYRDRYGQSLLQDSAAGLLSRAWAEDRQPFAAALTPYAALSRWLLEQHDLAAARRQILRYADQPRHSAGIDWQAEETAALAQAAALTDNNGFGMLNDYYSTYIGHRLPQMEGKDEGLSYAESPEYEDLRCLLEICRVKGMRVLFVHVPMHGPWSDYTGFDRADREAYYEKVRAITADYDNVELLDLTGYEYEPYFMCDTMHLGWKGWLAVDRAITDFVAAAQ